MTPVDNQFVDLNLLQKYAIVPAKGDRVVITYVLLKSEHVASYQHALLSKNDFPVTPFAYPTRKRLVKKGPDPHEEPLDMKTVVRHYAQGSSSTNTLHLDTGYWGDWSLDEKRYFLAAALRVEQDNSGILIPFFVRSYAMRFAAEMLRHKALGFSWNMPAFGEEVGMWRSQDKKLIKSANNRGAIGRLIEVTPWQNGTTSLIAKGSDLQDPEIIHGLQPKTVAVECLCLAEPRTIPEGWTKPAWGGG